MYQSDPPRPPRETLPTMYDLPTGNPGEEFDWEAFEAKFPSAYPGQAKEEYQKCLEEHEAVPTHDQIALENKLAAQERAAKDQVDEFTKQLAIEQKKTARLRAQLRSLGVEPAL